MNINTPEMWDAAWAKSHARYSESAERQELARLVMAALPEGVHVLDIGGGCGAFPLLYERVTVLDFAPWAVEYLRGRGIDARVWDARNPTPVEGRYDAVVCMDLLEHLDEPEKVVAFARGIAPLGCFTAPNNCMGPDSCRQHQRTYTEASLRHLLEREWEHIDVQISALWLLAVTR